MKVNELIGQLEKIKDKEKKVVVCLKTTEHGIFRVTLVEVTAAVRGTREEDNRIVITTFNE